MSAAAATAAVGIALRRLLPVIARIACVYGPLPPEVQEKGRSSFARPCGIR